MTPLKYLKIGGHTIECSHLDKLFFPKSGIRKEDLVSYYKDIASLVLPYWKNRPLTMERYPDGIEGNTFIQKGIPSYFPPWIDHHIVSIKESIQDQVLVNKAATLVYVANQACITFHLSLSKIDKINYPSYLIFDFDPSEENIKLLKSVINRAKRVLDYLKITPFIQTTGSRGFHVYVPLKREFTFKETHIFAKTFASYLAKEYPDDITIEQSIKKRENKVFIDYARNSYGLNQVAPYSIRAKENAPIATPLHWEELEDKALTSQFYNIKNIFNRLSKVKDPWTKMSHCQASIQSMQKKLDELINSN